MHVARFRNVNQGLTVVLAVDVAECEHLRDRKDKSDDAQPHANVKLIVKIYTYAVQIQPAAHTCVRARGLAM